MTTDTTAHRAWIKPLGTPHRFMRAIARGPRRIGQIREAMEEDGHPAGTGLGMSQIIVQLTERGLITSDCDQGQPHSATLYDLTEEGEPALKATEAHIKEALARQQSRRLLEQLRNAGPPPDPLPVINPEDARLLTSSPSARAASAADLAPSALRPGSQDHQRHPSRYGDRLHYRDGRVTTLAGTPITTPRKAA